MSGLRFDLIGVAVPCFRDAGVSAERSFVPGKVESQQWGQIMCKRLQNCG